MTFLNNTVKMARKRHNPVDIEKINKAYLVKCEEFRAMTLDELRTYYQANPKIGGSYKQALFDMVNTKLQERKEEVINETIEEIKSEDKQEIQSEDKPAT